MDEAVEPEAEADGHEATVVAKEVLITNDLAIQRVPAGQSGHPPEYKEVENGKHQKRAERIGSDPGRPLLREMPECLKQRNRCGTDRREEQDGAQ